MDPIEKRELKRMARLRLAARRRRAGLLRGRVVALSLICFVALWTIVFVQMQTGNDPVLASKKTAPRTRTTASVKPKVEPEEAAAEVVEEVEPEFVEEVEPEFVEEPLVTSQS